MHSTLLFLIALLCRISNSTVSINSILRTYFSYDKTVCMAKKILKFCVGLGILISFYFLALGIIKYTHLRIPPAILGLILFASSLISGIVKEDWIKQTSEFFLKYMALLFVPFIVGLVVYQSVLLKNWISIAVVIFFATVLTIVFTGLFVEYGIKFLRLHRMRKHND